MRGRRIIELVRRHPNWMEKRKVYKQELAKTVDERDLFSKNQPKSDEPMTIPTDLQKKYVYDVYDKIAEHFSHTRYKAWPRIEKFLNGMETGSLVLDVGCGNGKYLNVNPNLFMVGTDRSKGLLDTALEKNANNQLFAADSLRLPVRSSLFDYVISIAVIHHFSNDKLRHQAIEQILRVLRPSGLALIYVWAFEQEQRKFAEQDVFVPWNLHFKYEGEHDLKKKKENPNQELEINEQKQTVVYKRYYHVFKEGELEGLVKQHKEARIVESFYDHANWCVVLEKLG